MKFWQLGLIGLAIAAAVFYWYRPPPKLVVGTTPVKISVADNFKTRQQGLSGLDKLAEDEGMLFVFDEPGRYGFWMKEMQFDLDFIWINQERVVDLTEAVPAPQAGEMPVTIRPNQQADRVLEVNSGFIQRNNIKIGDVVKY